MDKDTIVLTHNEGVRLVIPYNIQLSLTIDGAGELCVERVDGGTLSAVALTRACVLLLMMPVSRRQYEG